VVFKDYCGVLSEESLRFNFALVYEILDETMVNPISFSLFPFSAPFFLLSLSPPFLFCFYFVFYFVLFYFILFYFVRTLDTRKLPLLMLSNLLFMINQLKFEIPKIKFPRDLKM